MIKISSFYKNRGPVAAILSVVFSILFVVAVVQAATTIGTNISTDGTVSVTGLSTFGNASSTQFSVFNNAYFGATATSSFSSTGALTLVNALTYGGITLSNAVTGTGNMVLSASPTFTGTIVGASQTLSGTLGVTGLTTLGNATSSMFSVTGMTYLDGGLTIDTDKFTVADATGNTVIAGTLNVTGKTTLGNATTTQATITTLWPTDVYGFTLQGAITGNSQSITGLSQLTVTSTTATSTFSTGGLTIGTDKFIIEQSSGKLGIGTSTPANFISAHLSNTASLDFGVIAANSCSALTMTVIGAADGETVILGVPNALASASSTLTFFGFVSAANTVTVRVCQVASLATSDPAAATIRADVWKH
jgi:hypothetical protein